MNERETMSFKPIRVNDKGEVLYNLRVVPYSELTKEERFLISCEPRCLEYTESGWRVKEMPIICHDSRDINYLLVYIYEDMNDLERKIYFDKFKTMDICSPDIEPLFQKKKKEDNFNRESGKTKKKGRFLRK